MNKDIDNLLKRLIQISETLDRVENKVDLISSNNEINNDDLLDNQDVLQLLKISYRTLQRYRTEGILPYQNMRNKKGKVGYRKSDIQKFITDYENGDLNKSLRKKT